MKSTLILSVCIICSVLTPAGAFADSPDEAGGKPFTFNEVWGYLIRGSEGRLTGDEPITDVCWFSMGVNHRGGLSAPAAPPSIKNSRGGRTRVHLVISDLSNKALMHFCLNPSYGVRDRLVGEIVAASSGYQGVQIDFESIAGGDAAAFIGFLKELKRRLPGGMILSVAVPARRKNVEDAYSYGDISSAADRVGVMAYDQHWSGSAPGPVASLSWCRDVLAYAMKNVPPGKLIMGLPLYGRSWQDRNYSRALLPGHVDEIIRTEKAAPEYSIDRGPSLSYEKTVQVKIYYEDFRSINEKLALYAGSVRSISFWRLGMERNGLWKNVLVQSSDLHR